VTAYIALGSIYNDSDRGEEAQALYSELLAKAPDTPEVHFVMARTLAELMRGSLEYRWESERHVFDLRLPIGGARHHEQIAS